MSQTVNQLALELIRAHREDSSDANYVLTVEQWIRDALDEFGLETNWRAFQTTSTLVTVASQLVYKLPFAVRDIRFIRDPATETNLVYLTQERCALLNFDLENVSRPQFWGYYDLLLDTVPNPDEYTYEIFLHPIPDTIYNYNIGYQINPANLITSDIIPLLRDHLFTIKAGVRAYMCMEDKDYDGAQAWRAIFERNISKARIRENTKLNDSPQMQIRDIPNRTDRRLARLDPNHFS